MYAYKPFALFALLFAGALIEIHAWAARKKRLYSLLIAAFMILTLACHLVSVKHKEHLMRQNGQLANDMIEKIKAQAPALPPNTPVLVSNTDPAPDISYSIFYMHGVHLLGGGGFIEMIYGHKPVEYRFMLPSDLKLRLADLKKPTLVITWGRGKVTARLFEQSPEKLWF
jgi:hypothetical protein